MPARQSSFNKRLLCPELASTLRNPILPKVVSKRKYVGLDEPNFDQDVEKKRPDAGKEYDPEGDYIYDARKYFNPEKYREIVAHQEEKKKKQEESENKFYYKAFHRDRRRYHNIYNSGHGHLSVDAVDVDRDSLSLPASSLQYTEYSVSDSILQTDDSHSSKHNKKAKKKCKHSEHSHSHASNSSHKHSKRKKGDNKKHKKKHKRKKSAGTHSVSLTDNHDDHGTSSKKHRAKLRHRSRHRSRLFSSQETNITSYGISNLGENSVGNTCDKSDLYYLSDDSANGLYYRQSPYRDSAENFSYSEDDSSNFEDRQVTEHAAGI